MIFTLDAVMITACLYVALHTHGFSLWLASVLSAWFMYGLLADIRRTMYHPVSLTINDEPTDAQGVYNEFGEDGMIRMQFLWALAQVPFRHYRIKRIEIRDGDPTRFHYTLRLRHLFNNKEKVRWHIQKLLYAELKEYDLTDLKFEVEVTR